MVDENLLSIRNWFFLSEFGRLSLLKEGRDEREVVVVERRGVSFCELQKHLLCVNWVEPGLERSS